jgi:hypothetical protein
VRHPSIHSSGGPWNAVQNLAQNSKFKSFQQPKNPSFLSLPELSFEFEEVVFLVGFSCFQWELNAP